MITVLFIALLTIGIFLAYHYGRESGVRTGLRAAALVVVNSKEDPRPTFENWLNGVEENDA